MIYINHNRNDENGVPIKPSKKWFKTAEEATMVAIRERKQHDADGNIYGHAHVRAALEKLFHDKCAYCESKMTSVNDWNVDHFRPKGRVAERKDHPGYYWLTYDWENLYPACTYCNQRRKDKPRWDDLTYAATGGKLDQFPLKDESTRAMSHHDDVKQECILLIDPCNDNPEQYLHYDIKGQIHAVNNNSRGQTTINVCNLRRRRLCDPRRDSINATVDLLSLIYKIKSQDKNSDASEIMNFLEEHVLADRCRYAGAVRAVMNDPDAFGVMVD